jgi:hypothetical protein
MKSAKKPWQVAKDRRRVLESEWIEVRQTAVGRGIFATRAFKRGDKVCAFTGNAIPIAQADRYHQEHPEVARYWAATKRGTVIMPDVAATGAHLANHSCNPNSEFEDDTETRSYLVARRRIDEGDEITVYYGWVSDREDNACACGAEHCSGWIGMRWSRLDNGDISLKGADMVRFMEVAYRNDNAKGARQVVDSMSVKMPGFSEKFVLDKYLPPGSPEFEWWARVLRSDPRA